MKQVSLLIIFFSFLLNMAFLDFTPKTEVEKDKFINIKASSIIESLLANNFDIAKNNNPEKGYFLLNMKNSSDIAVKIYANSQLAKPNGIFIFVNLNKEISNTESDKSKRPIKKEVFSSIKKSLSTLNCSDNIDFLRSGFTCEEGNYEITYTINGDSIDGLRSFFGFDKRSELLINIKPIN